MTKELTYLCKTDEPTEGEGLLVEVPGLPALAVFKYQGSFYAIEDLCTHGSASLCDGEVDGFEVECPFHAGAFNFMTGKPTAAPCTVPAKTYQIITVDNKLYVES